EEDEKERRGSEDDLKNALENAHDTPAGTGRRIDITKRPLSRYTRCSCASALSSPCSAWGASRRRARSTRVSPTSITAIRSSARGGRRDRAFGSARLRSLLIQRTRPPPTQYRSCSCIPGERAC